MTARHTGRGPLVHWVFEDLVAGTYLVDLVFAPSSEVRKSCLGLHGSTSCTLLINPESEQPQLAQGWTFIFF